MVQKLIRYIEIEEFKKVLKAELDKKFKLAYSLGMGSGLRMGEIVGLREQVCPQCGNLVVQRTIEINGRKSKKLYCNKCDKDFISKETKRSKDIWKIKPLTINQIDLEKRQIKIFGKGGKERITITSPWLNEKNIKLLPLKIERRTLQNHFTKLCEKTLGKKLNFHTLRHGWANYLANNPDQKKRVSLPVLQVLGGWSRLDTVGIYTRANPVLAVKSGYEAF